MAWELIGSIAFIVIFVVGVIVAWFKEKIGGIILVASAVAASICSIIFSFAPNSDDLMMLILLAGIPFLIIGILFLVCWRKSRKLNVSQ